MPYHDVYVEFFSKKGTSKPKRQKIAELDILLWVECVWTKVNLADPPSRGLPPPVHGAFRVGPGARKRFLSDPGFQ